MLIIDKRCSCGFLKGFWSEERIMVLGGPAAFAMLVYSVFSWSFMQDCFNVMNYMFSSIF